VLAVTLVVIVGAGPQAADGIILSDLINKIRGAVMRANLSRFLLTCLALLSLFASFAHAQGQFVYSNNQDGVFPDTTNTVSGFSVGPDGSLTEIEGSPFKTGGVGTPGYLGTNYIIVVGGFLYAANAASGSIAAFSINPATGVLSPVSGSPFSLDGITWAGISLAATPDGKFLIATNNFLDTISVYRIADNGSLTLISSPSYSVRGQVAGTKISPNGKFLAVATFGGVYMYSIGSGGALTVVAGSPFPTKLGFGVNNSVDINCRSDLLFVTDYESYSYQDVTEGRAITASVYRISPDGTLSHVADTPPIRGFGYATSHLFLSPNGQRLFVSDTSGSIAAFAVAPEGSLSLIPGSPFSIHVENISTDAVPYGMVTNSTGSFLYYAIYRNHIGGFAVEGDGALIPVPSTPFTPRAVGILTAITSLAAYPAKTCGPSFDLCIQDESNGNILSLNTTTGAYQFTNCAGLTTGGTGLLTRRGSLITLQHNAADRRVMASIDTATSRASASLQLFSQGTTFSITDRNITNNTCACR
jgi:6-phosphogluconolactonase (cycloisomerase 2 family)